MDDDVTTDPVSRGSVGTSRHLIYTYSKTSKGPRTVVQWPAEYRSQASASPRMDDS